MGDDFLSMKGLSVQIINVLQRKFKNGNLRMKNDTFVLVVVGDNWGFVFPARLLRSSDWRG